MHYRSQLFVPGNRPDRFDKACAAGADLVCIDIEDAVGALDKNSARETTLKWLSETEHKNVSLRINSVDTEVGQTDVKALAKSGLKLPFVMVPKVASEEDLTELDHDLPKDLGPFFAIIESAVGVVNVHNIFSHPRVMLGMYGSVDYAGDVNCDLEWETHLYARSRLVAAAHTYGVHLFDTPHIHVRDLDDCEATTRQAKAIGIHARSAIHPAQIERIHAAYAPSAEEIEYATRVVAADNEAGGNVVLMDGKFIEAPIVKRARRVLALANI